MVSRAVSEGFPMPTMRLKLFLTVALLATATIPAQVRNRSASGIRLEPGVDPGALKVVALFDVATTVGGDYSFELRTTHIPAGGGAPTISVQIVMIDIPGVACNAASPAASCSGGTCPDMMKNGVPVAGTCRVRTVTNVGVYPIEECTCYYRRAPEDGADNVHARPGDRIRIEIVPLPGALAETPQHVGDETLEITVGGRADESMFAFSNRRRSPVAGQRDHAGATLDQSGLVRQGSGPYEYWGTPGTSVTSRQGAVAPNPPVSLVHGQPLTSNALIGNDTLDLSSLDIVIYDGAGVFNSPAACQVLAICPGPWVTDANGDYAFTYTLPNANGFIFHLQGISPDPGSVTGYALTPRNDIGVQPSVPANPPQIPPLTSGGNPYPFARDAIVPNHGHAASAAGVADGTLFSLLGAGFDATDPSTAKIEVNGIEADIWVVRPNEILFRLLPAHEDGLGGPVVVTSTSGTYFPNSDQMEAWVFVHPPASLIGSESPQTGPSTDPSGGFFSDPNEIQAMRGFLGPGDADLWGLKLLPANVSIRAVLCEVDPLTDQLITRCSMFPGAMCSMNPQSQLPLPPGPRHDLFLQHMIDAPSGLVLIREQQNGGPGTAAFAGMSGIPGPATNPTTDPDTPFVAQGMMDVLRVRHVMSTGASGQFDYLLLVSF